MRTTWNSGRRIRCIRLSSCAATKNDGTPVQPEQDTAPSSAPQPEKPAASDGQPTNSTTNTKTQQPTTNISLSNFPSANPSGNTQSVGNSQSSNLNWPEGKFLASKNRKVYHCMYCERGMTGAVNIREENKIWFDSEAEAKAAGKERCGNCW